MSPDIEVLRQWIGRTEEAVDTVTGAPTAGLAATLDHAAPPWPEGTVPPLGHWLYFLPRARQSDIAADGHPHKGGFLPPVPLPRRMWAGGRLEFRRPLMVGETVTRRSTIAEVTHKAGRAGDLVFVKVVHEIAGPDDLRVVREEHDIVYRDPPRAASTTGAAAGKAPPEAAWRRTVRSDIVLLFRFSALTFNGHRIHYDRDWCLNEEGYPGLVVHGPLTATLLVDLFLCENPGATVTAFSFRAYRPLFDTAPFTLCGRPTDQGADLWALTPEGEVAMRADLTAR